MNTIINISAFLILASLWLAFGAALVWNQTLINRAWRSFRTWPLLAQAIITFLVLPVVLGLAVYQSRWPFILRLAIVAGLAWVTVYTFLPPA